MNKLDLRQLGTLLGQPIYLDVAALNTYDRERIEVLAIKILHKALMGSERTGIDMLLADCLTCRHPMSIHRPDCVVKGCSCRSGV